MVGISADPFSEVESNEKSTGSIAGIVAEQVNQGLKHGPAHLGVVSVGSVAARPRRANYLGPGGPFQWTHHPSEQDGDLASKTLTESSEVKRGKIEKWMIYTDALKRPRARFWISIILFAFLFFIWPSVHVADGKTSYASLAAYIRRGRSEDHDCRGRKVFSYDLPSEFNTVVHNESKCRYSLVKWMDLCPRFENGGYGERLSDNAKQTDKAKQRQQQSDEEDGGFDLSQWFDTDGYMLEMIFHSRMRTYRCLTSDPSEADAVFVPYYTGLHALDYLYEMPDLSQTFAKRKMFGKELIDWLESKGGEAWRRYGGVDHFLIMGRTSWDFQLQKMWGTGFSALPHIANMTALMLERDTRAGNEQAIPYPTALHAASPEKLRRWIRKVSTVDRKYLFSYVAAPRPDDWSVRGIVGSSCAKAGPDVCHWVDCSAVKCSHDPVAIAKHFLRSTFCLQPRGDSATRKSTFDCLISGAIPVFFHADSAYTQYSWHLPPQAESYSVYIDQEDLKRGRSIRDVLMSYSSEQIREMRETIIDFIPNLLYNYYATDPWTPTQRKDAFEISVERVLERVAAAKINYRNTSMSA